MDSMGTSFLEAVMFNGFMSNLISDQYYKYFQYAPLFIIFFFISFLLTPLVGNVAKKLGVLNATKKETSNKLNKFENEERRINPNRVPLLGGLAVAIPLLFAIPLFLGFNATTVPIIICLIILIIGGALDDAYNLPGTIQLGIQFSVALIVALTIADIYIIKVPFDGVISLDWAVWTNEILGSTINFVFPGDIIAILWIIICMNAVKWVNGLDALMESNMIIAYTLLFIIGMRSNEALVIVISAITVGGLSAFTIFNFPPAKIFSAATGAQVYGFLIATLSVLNQTKFATTIIILMLPLADFGIVVLKRLSVQRPKGFKEIISVPVKLIRSPDTNHLHHQLLKLNLTNKQILLVEIIVMIFIGSLAVLTTEAYRFFIILFGGLVLATMILLLHILTHKRRIKELDKVKEKETPESRYSY